MSEAPRGSQAPARSGSALRRGSRRPPTKNSEISSPKSAAIATNRKPAWTPAAKESLMIGTITF